VRGNRQRGQQQQAGEQKPFHGQIRVREGFTLTVVVPISQYAAAASWLPVGAQRRAPQAYAWDSA
jgi:hypothetical protein